MKKTSGNKKARNKRNKNQQNKNFQSRKVVISAETTGRVSQEANTGSSKNAVETVAKKSNPSRKLKILLYSFFGVILFLALTVYLAINTKIGRSILIDWASGYISDNVNKSNEFKYSDVDDGLGDLFVDLNLPDKKEESDKTNENNESLGQGGAATPVLTPQTGEKEPEMKDVPKEEKIILQTDYVSNYLLIGIESIYHGRNTDAIMILSINTRDNKVFLTSILRDTLVNLPGFSQNKINAAYAKGGADFLKQVVEENFRIKIDGYASVDFESFEYIVDLLGGIEMELTQEESEYLNTTNYISKEENRNTVPGVQLLNGNQVLGYCRVRKVPTLNGVNYDYGRTIRQRYVLSKIFETYKKQNLITLLKITDQIIGCITTDLTKDVIKKELTNIIDNGITTLETSRIPADGKYESVKELGTLKDVLVPDLSSNIELLYESVYGIR